MRTLLLILLVVAIVNADQVGDNVQRLMQIANTDSLGYDRLCEICDEIGIRIAGTPEYVEASNMVANMMMQDGFSRVFRHTAQISNWSPGKSSLTMLKPRFRMMNDILPLGAAIGTGPEGIEAQILVVRDFDDLKAKQDLAKGRIVVFNQKWEGYGISVGYRAIGPRTALQYGAVACLVRSVTGYSLQSPHTGITARDVMIPSAAISVEDAMMLQRMQDRYPNRPIVLRFISGATMNGTVPHDSLIADIKGSVWPDQTIILSGHLDSWMSPGAQDDLSGAIAAWNAGRYIIKAGIKPKRTIRVIAWMGEEFGGIGGIQYAKDYANELANYSLAMEFDDGLEEMSGFGITTTDAEIATLQSLTNKYMNGFPVTQGGGGVDIGPMGATGVPTASLSNPQFYDYMTGTYWNLHHTRADTPDKVNATVLAKTSGQIAALAYLISELDHPIARPPKPTPFKAPFP